MSEADHTNAPEQNTNDRQEFVAQSETTPRLRFPSFRGTEGWKKGVVGDVSTVVRGGSPRPIDEFITEDANGLNWLRIGDVNQGAKHIYMTSQKVLMSALSKTRTISPGDLILSNSMSFGRPYISHIHSCIHDGWLAVTKLQASLLNEFAYYLLLSEQSQSYFESAAAGSGVRNLNLERVAALPISWPNLEEQRKIAECFDSLDELIAAESEKLEALKRHKRGLLQQLFPAEGETTPRLRFSGRKSEWRRVPLVLLLSESPSYGLNAASTGYRVELPLYLRITDIDDEGKYLREGRVSVAQTVTSDAYLQPGDIAVARTGASVGKSYLCDGQDGPFVYAGFLIRLRPDPNKLLPALLAQWLRTDEYWRWITLTSARSGQPGINGTEYAGAAMPVPIGPLALQEQGEIASCLAVEDEIIGSLREKVARLRSHKAALMQQLFPSLDVTEL